MKKKFLQKLLPCALSTAIAFSMAPVPLYADSLPPVITSDYGNPSVPQSIPGNVQVTGSNITVQNTGIQGDLNITEVQLINVNSKMRKIEIIFKAKKAHLPLGENIIFSKDIDSLDLQYFMRLCRI